MSASRFGEFVKKANLSYVALCIHIGPVNMEGSFPASRVSRLDEFPGMYRKYTVLHSTIYMDSRETHLAGIPANRGGISHSRVSRSSHVNTRDLTK